MEISRGVFYQPFDDKIYVHNVDTQKDYILGGDALEVLNFFAENPNVSMEYAAEQIAKQFESDDFSEITTALCEFMEELQAEGILKDSTATVNKTDKIIKDIEFYYADNHKLFSISFELTYRCVEKCIHCYIDDADNFCAKNELTLDEYKNILKQAKEMGVVKILLTGGEVLLRPDLCDIAEYALSLGIIVDIYTTGLGLTDKIFERLCASKVNSVSFSLYSGNSEMHDKITGVQGSFEKTLKAMLMFRSAGINTFIKSVVINQNFSDIKSLYELGKRLKIDVNVSPKIFSGHETKSASDYRLENLKSYKEFFALDTDFRIGKFNRLGGTKFIAISEGTLCTAGKNAVSIDPFGGVRPCVGFKKPFGSVREDSLKNIWDGIGKLESFKISKLSQLTPKCKTCRYIKFCHACIAELFDDEKQSFNECSDELVMAQAAAEFYYQWEADFNERQSAKN
ncbi:MAG: radical SAM protein [Selenomonadaceae bacterium]|nr:radical SAM protein [Selenomonadaceae bacterium]